MSEPVEWDGQEELSFDDSDHFEEDSLCSWMSEPESLCRNWRGWQTQFSNGANNLEIRQEKTSNNKSKKGFVPSLIELSAQTVALQLPFEQVERFPVPIPENLQLRIAFWSFPESEDDIRLYSCLANGNADEFQKGEHLVKNNSIIEIMQIGFHLSATVQLPPTSINKGSCLVAVTFDRQRITTCACNCGSNAKWCSHVVALCLARIQQPDSVCLRAPVSESLSRLQRDQLQKFAQYLISELPQQILPTAQRLLDELLMSSSTAINEEPGAPDPTAGPSLSDISIWCLDEQALADNIKKTLVKFCGPSPIVYSDVNSLYLSSTEPPAASEYSSLLRPLRGREPEGIWNLLSIVREMLRRRDSNAFLLLDIITEQCLAFEQVAIWWYNTCTSVAHLHGGSSQHGSHRPTNNINSEIAQHAAASLCDEIVASWRLVLLSPSLQKSRKDELKVRLSRWHEKTLSIIKRGKYRESHLRLFPGFKEAIKMCDFNWNEGSCINMCRHIICTCGNSLSPIHSDNDTQLTGLPVKKYFMTKNDQESIMTAYRQELDYLFSRAESLYVHGFITEASKLAVKLANEILSNPENLVSETSPQRARSLEWSKSCTEYAYKTFERIVFLCNVLSENPEHRLLAFQIGLYGLQFERLPASSKAMEVKLFHKQLQITNIMKKLPLAAQEIEILREKAQCLIDYEENGNSLAPMAVGTKPTTVQHVLPLHLAMFIFDALCQPNKSSVAKERKSNNSSHHDSYGEGEITKADQELGFMACVTALGYKLNVSEAEHPLLCEGTRRQKGDLVVMLLVQFKNSHSKINMILEKSLDKALAPNLQATSAFTSESIPLQSSSVMSYAYRKTNSSCSSVCVPSSVPSKSSPLLKPLEKIAPTGMPFKYCSVCKTSFTHRAAHQNIHDSNSSTQADDSSEEEDSSHRSANARDDTDAAMASVLHKQMRIDSGNEDIKSSSCDEDFPVHVCSPQRRDGKTSWRSPTVRPKRRQHCITNVNSSASEEAMLSDTSPRLTRRGTANLALLPSSAGPSSSGGNSKTPTSSSAWLSRYPASPSSDSSSNHSLKSDDFESNDVMDKPSTSNQNVPHGQPSTTPPATQVLNQQNATITGSGGKSRSGNNFRMKNRGRNTISVPDIPNQPSEASAHFFFELAKTVLVKAGGNSSTSLFMQPQSSSQNGVNRNLLLAAFEIGLYALGMHNCVSPNWLSRTYSSHVSWISGQAMEIGSASLQILVDSWEGHLTPTETVSLADRASHGRDPTTVQVAAELALSVLPYAHAVNPNEVCRALYQCRDQGPEMLEKANKAVEQAGRSGGVHPEVLFAVAKQWQWLHENENQHARNVSPPQHQVVPVTVPSIAQQTYALPIPAGAANVAGSVAGMVLHPNVVAFQSDNTVRPHQPVGLAVHPSNIPQSVTIIPQASARPPLLHPSAGFATTPIVTQAPIPSRSQIPVLDTQYTSNAGNCHHVVTQHLVPSGSGIPLTHHTYSNTIHHHAASINLQSMPHSNRFYALQYNGAFLADALTHTHQHHAPHQTIPLPTAIASIAPNTLTIHNHASTYRLQSAFRVGMLAMDLLAKRTEERPNSKYAKNPPYTQNVKWLLKLSMELGGHCLQQFCLAAVTAIHSPFLLQDIAVETAQFLASNNHQQACSNLRLPFLQPIVQRCVQMYIQFIHNRLYHLHHSDYDDFANLVQNSKTAFLMTPGGLIQYNEVISTIRRSKVCKKELWQKIVAGLAMPPTSV